MVINILVHIESCEDVECVAEVDISWNKDIAFENWEKVCSADYRVHMNDGHDPIPVTVEIRLDDPHAVVGIGIVEGLAKVVNERTRKCVIPDFKRKK